MVLVGTQPDEAYFVRKQSRERFKELCEHAEVVDDPEELAKIAAQISRILESAVVALKKNPSSHI
jgi:hypothetical protein